MSDNYVSRLERLLMVLNDIVQKVPEAKGLLNNLGVDPADPYLQTTAVDKTTGETRKRTENEAKVRVEDLESAIKENERLNELIQRRISLIQQETNATKQAKGATGSTTTTPRGARPSSAKEPQLPGEFSIAEPATNVAGLPLKRREVLENDKDANALSTSELAQLKLAVRAIAKKLTEAGSKRGAAMLQAIKPGSSTASTVDAFEEALSTVVMREETGSAYSSLGYEMSTRMGSVDQVRQALPTIRQIIKQAVARPVTPRKQVDGRSLAQDAPGMGDTVIAEEITQNPDTGFRTQEGRAVGQARRRSLHNTFGKTRDTLKNLLGIPIGKGTDEDLTVQADRNRGYVESAAPDGVLQEGVAESIVKTMKSVVAQSIQDVRAGRVSKPSSGSGGQAQQAIPETLKAILVRQAPQIEAAAQDTTARGAIGKEGGGIGVLGAPDAQNTLVGIFAAMVAAKLSQPRTGKTKQAQEEALRSINVEEIFENVFADVGFGKEQETSIAGIMHRRVGESLRKKVKDAEESYVTETDSGIKRRKWGELKAAQTNLATYEKLDEIHAARQIAPKEETPAAVEETKTEKKSAPAVVTKSAEPAPSKRAYFEPDYSKREVHTSDDKTVAAYAAAHPEKRVSEDSMVISHDSEERQLTAAISDGVSKSTRSQLVSKVLARAATLVPKEQKFTLDSILGVANKLPLASIESDIDEAYPGEKTSLEKELAEMSGSTRAMSLEARKRAKQRAEKEKRTATVADYFDEYSKVDEEAMGSDEEFAKYYDGDTGYAKELDLAGRRARLASNRSRDSGTAATSNATLAAYRRTQDASGKYRHEVVRLGDTPIVSAGLNIPLSASLMPEGTNPSQVVAGRGGLVMNNKPHNPLYERSSVTDEPVGVVLASDAFVTKDPNITNVLDNPDRMHRGVVNPTSLQAIAEDPRKYSVQDDRSLIVIGSKSTEPSVQIPYTEGARRAASSADVEELSVTPAEVPTTPTRRRTDATMSMRYKMPQNQLREDLRGRYSAGTTTAQLVQEGVRSATTRSGGGYRPGQIVEMPEVPGKRYQVTSVEKPDFSTPEGIAAWEAKEGWSFKDLPDALRRQVTDPKANQISFKPYEETTSTAIVPTSGSSLSTESAPEEIYVPADMISNPTATITGRDTDPEEMIQRVAGGKFDSTVRFRDFVTNVTSQAKKVIPYLSKIGRTNLPIPFDAATPLRRIVENDAEGVPLDDELPSETQQQELATIKRKKTDNVLAGLGLTGTNSKYQNFFGGLEIAQQITGEDGKIKSEVARGLPNPLAKAKSYFSAIQQLEQSQYNGFPLIDYANAKDESNPNAELAEQMEKTSPILTNLDNETLSRIRDVSRTDEFRESDSFNQFAQLAETIRPVLEPLLGEGAEGESIVDTLSNAPKLAKAGLPLLHTPGTMSDKVATLLGRTDELSDVRKPTAPISTATQLAKGLRYHVSSLARSITGRFPSPAYNDLVVQRHKELGIVEKAPDEDLTITNELADRQYLKSLSPEERAAYIGEEEIENYEAGENARIEEERQRVQRILKNPKNAEELKERGVIEARIAAGEEPLGPLFDDPDKLTNDIVYDHEGNKGYSKKPTRINRSPDAETPLDQVITAFHKQYGDNQGLKQLLATAIGSPTARKDILDFFKTMQPGMVNNLRFTDFGNQTEVDNLLRQSKNNPEVKKIVDLMKREKGEKYLKDPSISEAFARAVEVLPVAEAVAERQESSGEEKKLASNIGTKLGKLRVINKLRNFGFPSQDNLDSNVDSETVQQLQTVLSVLSPENTEEFRKIDASDPKQIDQLNKDRDREREEEKKRVERRYQNQRERDRLNGKIADRFEAKGIVNLPLKERANRMLRSRQIREQNGVDIESENFKPGMSILDRARQTAFGLSERLYKMQEGFKTTPSEDIKRLEKQIPKDASSIYAGKTVENAQILAGDLKKSVSYAIEGGIHMDAKERMDERIDTLSPDEEEQYEIAMKDYEEKAAKRRILRDKYAERQDQRREEVNAMIDASVERRGRPVSWEARQRILRSMALPEINFWSNLKKPRRPGEAIGRDERQALYEESPEKQEAEAAVAAHRESLRKMPMPVIKYSFNRDNERVLPEVAGQLEKIPEVEQAVKDQYGQTVTRFVHPYGSAFGGAGIQADSEAYRNAQAARIGARTAPLVSTDDPVFDLDRKIEKRAQAKGIPIDLAMRDRAQRMLQKRLAREEKEREEAAYAEELERQRQERMSDAAEREKSTKKLTSPEFSKQNEALREKLARKFTPPDTLTDEEKDKFEADNTTRKTELWRRARRFLYRAHGIDPDEIEPQKVSKPKEARAKLLNTPEARKEYERLDEKLQERAVAKKTVVNPAVRARARRMISSRLSRELDQRTRENKEKIAERKAIEITPGIGAGDSLSESKRARVNEAIETERIEREKEEARKAREFREYEDRVTGRRLLPAPDPNKPEEEYTKTAEQLAAEEPARIAAETAQRRSDAARRAAETRRRNARRKRIENAYTDYDAGAVVPPSTLEGIPLEDKKQKKIDEDRINRRKARSIESKRREPETNAKVAAREAGPIAERTKRLEDERLANEAERQRMIDEDRINRRKARSIEGKRRQVEREEREKEEARKAREFREYEDRVTGRRLLPAPDPSKPEEEYTKTHSQLEAERVAKTAADDAETKRLRDRKRRAAARANNILREYSAGRGARPRRQFNLPGPTIEVDPVQVREATQGAFEEYLSGDMSVRRPLSYQRQNRPKSKFQLFRERIAARYRRSTNEGVDVGQMPLVADSVREQPATIAEERELRRQQIKKSESRIKERKVEEMIKVGDEYVAELDKKEENAWLEKERQRITEEKEKKKIDEDRLNRRKAKSIESKRRQPETAAKVAAREEKQYMSEPAVARRTRVAEERRDKREQEAESEIRSIREVTRRREDAEIREEEYGGRLKFIRRLNFDARLPKPGATYQPPKYERQQSVDNPEYQAAVEQAREKVNKIAGLSESQRASQLQRLIGKITIPKKIKPPETPAGPVSRFTKFKESTSSLFRRFTGELADIKNEVTNEGMDISALPLFPDVGTGKNVSVRDTPRIARKRNEAAERLADRSETDAKIAAREAGPRAARREKLEAERAEKKRVIDEERLNRRKAKSIESKRRQPRTEAKVAARERKAYFSDPAVARRAAAGEVYDGESRPTMMVNPAIANRRAEIDRRIDERTKSKQAAFSITEADIDLSQKKKLIADATAAITGGKDPKDYSSEEKEALKLLTAAAAPRSTKKSVVTALKKVNDVKVAQEQEKVRAKAHSLLGKEENPEYAKAVSNVKKWMDQERIKDPAQREKFLSMINVPRYRDMDRLVEKPNAYKVQVQRTRDKDNINLAELRDYASGRHLPPTDNPELQKSLAARVVEDAIQRKYYSDMGPLTAEETASRDAKAQRARDRLVKNIRPYNDDWRREQRRAKIEQIMTRPEEILSEAEKNAKADLIARAAKGEDVYELDPAKSGKGRKGSGGGGGGGGGGDDPPEDGDEGTGGKGKGKGRGGKGDSTSVTAESIVINAKTVIANGAPVNVIAKTVMTGVPPKGGAGASSGTGAASGTPATGAPTAPGAPGTIATPAAVPSGPIMPGSSTARFVRMSPFGPVYSTAPASAAPGAPGAPGTTASGTAATTAAGASISIGGAGMSGLFAGLFGGGGFGGGGGGTAGPFGLGGEFGEAGNRTFGADRLMSVNRLKAMRNAYEQNMGSLSGFNVGVSRSQLVNTAQTTMMDIVDHEGSFKSLVQSASDAGLATEAADIQQAYDSMLDPTKTIADLATDLLKLQTALANLGKAAKAAEENVASSDDVKEAARKTQGQVSVTSLLANYAAEEQDKVRQDLEREGNRRLGNLREGLQANTTQQSAFGWTVGQALTRRRLLREYATAATGGNPDELYRGGDISVYRPATVVKGLQVRGERRVNIREATQADLEYTQQKLAQKSNAAMSVQDLATLQKTMNEEKSQRNQTSMASRFSHITQKAQQANYWATAAFNAPTDVMNLVDQAVRPALNAEKTMITARTLALTPEAYGNAMQAAQTQQSMFGGTLTKNIGAVTGFIPMANAYGVDINKTFNVARKLAAFDPAQGTEGAQIALREFLSGNMSSLSRRFELSRSALTQINQGDASEMIDSLDNLLAGMGITDRLIDDQAASMATKYDKMLGRLESVQLHFSKLAVNAISPILEKFAGEDSWMATKTKTDTTTSVLNERVAKVGDDVITNSKNGSKTIKDLDLNSATFFEDLDSVISNANDAMIKENKLIEETTGVDVNAKLYKRVNSMKPWEREKYLADIRFKTMTGMGVESAIRQTMNEQTDYAGFEQFVTSRRELGVLGLTQADTDKRYADANTAIFGQSGTKLTVKEMNVLDGDTFRFELPGDASIDGRILGIDAPESDTEEGKQVTSFLESVTADPNNKIEIIKGYGQDENGREIIRAEVTNQLTGEKYDLGAKMLSEGMADFEDFGKSGNVTKEIQNIYAAYAPIAESVADQGKGFVNSIAARGGYGAAIRPSQEAIDAQYANTYGIGGSTLAGLAPTALTAGIAGGVAGQMLIPVPGVGFGIGFLVAGAGAAAGQHAYQSSVYDKDTSIEKVQGEIAQQEKIERRAKLEESIKAKARITVMNAAKNEYNLGLQSSFESGYITEEKLKEMTLTDADVTEIDKILTDKDPEKSEPAGGWTAGARKLLAAANNTAGDLTEELADEYEKQRADIESRVMQQVSSLNPAYQGVLDFQVPSTLDPSKTVPWIKEAIDTMALQATSGTEVEGAKTLSGAKIDKEANSFSELLTLFLNPDNQQAISAVVNAGELVKIPTGETTTRIDPETKKEVEEPVYTYAQITPDRVHQAITEKDTSFFNATLETAKTIKVEGKSTFYEEAKKATETLLDEQTKLRETLVVRVSENAALLSFTGLGEVAARQAEEGKVNTESAIPGGYDTGTSGAAIPRTTEYNPLERAAAFIDGTELDASASGNKNAQVEMETLLKGSIKKIAKSVEAFDQIAATTYAFDVQFRGTFRNFVDSVKAAGKGANTIMSHMGQGNPKFALEYLDQITGINAKQFTMQYQLNPGMPNKQINGPSATYGYTQGPMGTMKFVSDFFSNGDFAAQFNLGESMQMINMAASANTQMVQRGMQHNWQMQDLARDNARSIAEINRNGMLSLQNIHRGYVQQMLVLASQAEVNKRMSEVSTQEAIGTADLPADVRNKIDVEDKIGRANAQYLGQFNIEGYLEKGVGAQDTEMKGLFDQFKSMGNPDSPEAQKFWEEVIRPAANKRKDAAFARSQDESLSTEERTAATEEYISLSENPELTTRALAIQDEETKNKLRRASTIRQAEKNLERLQLQRQSLIATGARLSEQGQKGTPEEQAAVGLQIKENQQALKENGEAMELASRTIGTLRAQDADWNLAFLEQWKQLKTGIGTTTAGVVLSIEELARNMDLQLTEAYRKFELARTDMITAFTRSATEIAIQVPLSLMPMYDAILAYQNMSAKAQIAYNNGIEVTESVGDINGNGVIDPFEAGQTRTTGGPQAAFNIQMQGAQAAAEILYPNKDDPARAKLLSTIAEYARTMFPKADPKRDRSSDGLPVGFDQFTMMYEGIQTLRVMVVNGKELGLVNIVPTSSITPGDKNGNGVLDIYE